MINSLKLMTKTLQKKNVKKLVMKEPKEKKKDLKNLKKRKKKEKEQKQKRKLKKMENDFHFILNKNLINRSF